MDIIESFSVHNVRLIYFKNSKITFLLHFFNVIMDSDGLQTAEMLNLCIRLFKKKIDLLRIYRWTTYNI